MKFYDKPPRISENAKRSIKKFAWVPIDVRERETNRTLMIWLEPYYVAQFWTLGYGWTTSDQWIPAPGKPQS